MKKKYWIERGRYVASCEFETQDHFDKFLKTCQEKCEKLNALYKEEEDENPRKITRFAFEFRSNLEKTDGELYTEAPDAPSFVSDFILTKIYPDSVLEDAPADLVDKQANWNKRKIYAQEDIWDIETMQQYLDRAEQIWKKMKKRQRAPRTKDVDIERAIDFVVIGGMSQNEASKEAGIPKNSLSRGKGAEKLQNRLNEMAIDRRMNQDEDKPQSPRVPRKELEAHFVCEELGQGKKKD